LIMFRGAATPSSVLNGSMAGRTIANSPKKWTLQKSPPEAGFSQAS